LFFLFLILWSVYGSPSPSGLLLREPVDLSGLDTTIDAFQFYPGACGTFAGFPTGMIDYQLLGYVNGLLIQQLEELNSQLTQMKSVLENQYDPNSESADLGSYIDGIRAFCGGRMCTECDCANVDSMCGEAECSLDITCTPFGELLTLETALLEAISAVNPGDSCLSMQSCA